MRRACAARELGFEEARGVCRDRDVWKCVTGRIMGVIKCGTRAYFPRGT